MSPRFSELVSTSTSAQRLVIPALPFVTFDLRQAQAARSLGFTVLGS